MATSDAVWQDDEQDRCSLRGVYQEALASDRRLEAMILYRKELVKCLFPDILLDHLSRLLSDEVRERIKATIKNSGQIAAARQLLDAILTCRKPNIYNIFLDILRETGQEKALGLMQGVRNIETERVFKEVIEVMRPGIVKCVVVDYALLNALVAGDCISEETKGRIECIQDGVSPNAAASSLLDEVTKLIRTWPQEFVRALRSTGNDEVVELLSPDFLEHDKSIEEVLDDMAKSNQLPESPSDDQPLPPFPSGPGPESSLGSEPASISQTSSNQGSGNFNIIADRGATVTVHNTVNIVAPDDTNQGNESGSENDQDVRAESLHFVSTSGDGSDVMDAPNRDDQIVRRKNIAMPSGVEKKDLQNGYVDEPEKQENADEASGYEKNGEEHTEKQDSESTKEKGDGLVLYDYQEKLARPGIEGKNTIICAPTGSGKTVIAAGIMKDHLKKQLGKNKVIFLACEVALANQQNKQFEKFIPEFKSFVISGAESGDKVPPIKMLLSDYDILVMTAQLLVNSMMSPKAAKFDNVMDLVKFDDFSMMVIDECHHTSSEHPYNRIMSKYIDEKLEKNQNLPQVLGLTASLGVGKASSMSKAIEHVVTMCANLDASELSNPDDDMMEQIQETANKPIMNTTVAKSRNPDPFQDIISTMMADIEKRLRKSCEGEDEKSFGNIPAEKGSQPYIQWISRIQKPIESSTNLPSLDRQRGLKYINYLKAYNRALLINHECRTRDALEYLKNELQKIEEVFIKDAEDVDDYFDGGDNGGDNGGDEVDEEQAWLEKQFKDAESKLLTISKDPTNNNPMLTELKQKILEKFPDEQSKADGRGIIFVQTREMTTALCRWIREDADLTDWNPEILVGANAKDPGPASMTQTKQLNILDYFKSGEHKLLVATSVAEEGLDIQKCNLIIRYNYVTNEIAMVQSRGRARADDSTYEVLTGGALGAKKAQKENLNKIREKMMVMAIETVKKWPKEKYEKHLLEFQSKFSKERKITNIVRMKKKAIGNQYGPYVLLCRWCTKGLCTAEELRLLAGTHHSVLSPDFKEKYRTKLLAKSKVYGDDLECKGKITCNSCFQELGVFALYKKVPFPLLKMSNLLIENPLRDGNDKPILDDKGEPSMNRVSYKQWKDVPFTVKEITDDELKHALSAVEGSANDEGDAATD